MRLSQHLGILLLSTIAAINAHAENGAQGWLRYAPITDSARYATLPNKIVVPGSTPTDQAAAHELQRGLTAMLGRPFTIAHETEENTSAIILTNLATLNKAFTITGD